MQRELGPWVSLSELSALPQGEQTWVINTSELDLSLPISSSRTSSATTWPRPTTGWTTTARPITYFEIPGTLTANGVKINPDQRVPLARSSQISDELQLQGKAVDGRLDFVLGVYYLQPDEQGAVEPDVLQLRPFGDTFPPPSPTRRSGRPN